LNLPFRALNFTERDKRGLAMAEMKLRQL